jgi:hypothetical protein
VHLGEALIRILPCPAATRTSRELGGRVHQVEKVRPIGGNSSVLLNIKIKHSARRISGLEAASFPFVKDHR